MSRLSGRVDALEAKHGSRNFMTVLPEGLTESEQAAFIASEKKRLGVGENDRLMLVRTGVPRADDAKWKRPRA